MSEVELDSVPAIVERRQRSVLNCETRESVRDIHHQQQLILTSLLHNLRFTTPSSATHPQEYYP